MRFAFIILVLLGAALLESCAPVLDRAPGGMGLQIEKRETKGIRIVDVQVDTLTADTARISCRVQKYGKHLDGNLDVAVLSDRGEILFQSGVRPLVSSRIGGYTIASLGFPFSFKLPSAILRKATLRFAFHPKDAVEPVFFVEGENLAL
jgi:hypothetical protein